jgi:phage regulator Rha-like protein
MSDMSEFVTQNDTTLTTDSRRVVKRFKKRHGDVLRAFDNPECSAKRDRLNFQAAFGTYINGKGGTQESRLIRMTKDEFSLA